MQLAADIAQRFEHVALDHHVAMTGDVDELGDILKESLPAGARAPAGAGCGVPNRPSVAHSRSAIASTPWIVAITNGKRNSS